MKHKNRLLAVFGYGTLILAFIFLGLMAYWAFYPYTTEQIVTFANDSHKITKNVVQQGEQTSYLVDYCKYKSPPVTVEKQFVDGIIFRSEDSISALSIGCHKQLVPLTIPDTLPPGNYKYRVTAIYRVNPIRTVTLIRETDWFTVVRDDSGAYGPTPSESNLIK